MFSVSREILWYNRFYYLFLVGLAFPGPLTVMNYSFYDQQEMY